MPIPLGFWAAAGGETNSFELISTTILGSDNPTISFTSLPAGYKHLQIRLTAKATGGGTAPIFMRYNSDSGSNYAFHHLRGDGSSVSSFGGTSQTYVELRDITGTTQASGVYGAMVVDLLDVFSTTKNKTSRMLGGFGASGWWVGLDSGLWMSTAAVTSVTLTTYGNFVAGSRFSLYGIKG